MSYRLAVFRNKSELDMCQIESGLSITHGRSGVAAQPDAPECTFTWVGATCPVALGDLIEVAATADAADLTGWVDPSRGWVDPAAGWLEVQTFRQFPRFVGNCVGIKAVEENGLVVQWDITAVGRQAQLGRIPVTLARPAETDTARVQGIVAAAGWTVKIWGKPGLTLAADTVDTDALAALHQVASGAGGLLWQDREGNLNYGSMHHRDPVSPGYDLPCSIILDGLEWEKDAEFVVNHITAQYGGSGAEQQITHRDDDSISRWGIMHADISTGASSAAGATDLALKVLGRRAEPYWRAPGCVVVGEECTTAELLDLLALEVSVPAVAPIPPDPAPVPANVHQWIVEGWVETWEPDNHTVQLALSDRTRFGSVLYRTWATAKSQTWAYWRDRDWLDQLMEVI